MQELAIDFGGDFTRKYTKMAPRSEVLRRAKEIRFPRGSSGNRFMGKKETCG
jgi:hypothetical protein